MFLPQRKCSGNQLAGSGHTQRRERSLSQQLRTEELPAGRKDTLLAVQKQQQKKPRT